jgi:hypothetical protein
VRRTRGINTSTLDLNGKEGKWEKKEKINKFQRRGK